MMIHWTSNFILTSVFSSLRATINLNLADIRHEIPEAESCQCSSQNHSL